MHARNFLAITLACCAALFSVGASAKDAHLDFITNGHQWPAQVKYKADLPGAVFLTNTGFTYSYYSLKDLERIHTLKHQPGSTTASLMGEPVRCQAYSVSLKGCNTAAQITPQQRTPNYYNYFLGNDPAQWSGGMPAYGEVDYGAIYDGIDLKVYSKGTALKYDFELAPGADASAIQLVFEGVLPKLSANGDLLIHTSVNELREKAPFAYQVVNGRRQQVTCKYTLRDGQVGFVFPKGYDHARQLVIDPVLVFATYSGSTSATFGWSATYDASGNLYAGGESFGTGWPVTTGAFQTTYGSAIDIGINKYSSNGSTLIYSTYYGGSSADYPNTMVVNKSGELIMAGATVSGNMPVTSGCFDNSYNNGLDVYVVHFNQSGTTLLGGTYLGGSGDEGNVSTSPGQQGNRGEVVTDTAGNIYVAFGTKSSNFPTTTGAYQTALSGTMDGFVTKLNSTCSNLLFSTYLGGSSTDAAITMQLSPTGNVVVGGGTTSTDFPGVASGWQSSLQGGTDGFIAVLNNTGTALLRATYVGTAGTDDVTKLQLDGTGSIYVAGVNATGAFPVSPGVYSVANGNVYIARFDTVLANRQLSTTIGISGTSQVNPSAFLVDVCGNIYFIGYGLITASISGLATTPNAFQSSTGGFWMCVLNPNMSSLTYASYFGTIGDHIDGGSSRLDPAGIVYHSICTNNSNQPTNSSVWSPTKKGTGYDIASWKFNFQLLGMVAHFDIGPKDTFCAPATISFTNTSTGAQSYLWNFGDGSATSTQALPPPHTYTTGGIYRIRLYTFNSGSCNPIDSDAHTIYVFDPNTVKLTPPDRLIICDGSDSAHIKVKPHWTIYVTPNASVSYQTSGETDIVFYPDTTTTYTVYASTNNPCAFPKADTIRFTIVRDTTVIGHVDPIADTILCIGDTAIYQPGRKMDRFSISPPSYVEISSDSTTIRFFPPATTKYQFIGIKSNLCGTIRDTLNFNIHRSTLRAAFNVTPKLTDLRDPEFKLINRSTGASSYNWYLNNSFWTTQTSPALMPADTGLYCFTLVARDDFACVDTADDCGHLIETHIYVPSAFTPNGDNKNDLFRPILNNVNIMVFSVYNRYGERIFVSYDNTHAWDGTYNGVPCDLGTYFYMIRYNILNRDPEMLKGDVTLLR